MPASSANPPDRLRAAAPALALLLLAGGAATAAELIDGAVVEPAVASLVHRAGASCRQQLAERFGASAEEVDLWLVPGQRIALESGEQGLADLRRQGLVFGWMLPQRPAPAPIGDCRSDGGGAVQEIRQQPD